MRVVLEVVGGTHVGRRFVFDRHDTFMVGRGKGAQFRIADDYFSRHHFMIEVNPPRCFLRDLGSLNGTYVNGERIRDAYLNDEDIIRGGLTAIQVRIEPSSPASGASAPGSGGLAPARPASSQTRARMVGMTTLPLNAASAPLAPPVLKCEHCQKPAGATLLDELIGTRLVSYVCDGCCQQRRSRQRPIPTYEATGVLGRGSLGPVYQARRLSTNTFVALKVLPPHMTSDPQAVKVFLRQMRIGIQLDHPKIVPMVEIGQAGQDLWVAMELADGCDAGKLAGQLGGRLSVADAVDVVIQVLDALGYAHGLNLVHRDVNPANVMVSGVPGAYLARLSDFGLIRHMDEAGLSGITREGQCRGTVPFMPPEQVIDSRFTKPAGDLYSAAATLYWLLTGEFAHDFEARDRRGEIKDPFVVVLEDPIVPICQRNRQVPPRLAQAIEKALAREPEDRFATAAEMARALRAAVA